MGWAMSSTQTVCFRPHHLSLLMGLFLQPHRWLTPPCTFTLRLQVAEQLRAGVEIKDRRHYLRVFKNCFVGSDAVAFMVSSGMTSCAEDAVALGNALLDAGLLAHVVRDHDFQDKALFYRFTADEDHGTVGEGKGRVLCKAKGGQANWAGGRKHEQTCLFAPLRRSLF